MMEKSYDIVIVGAGASGLAAARILCRQGKNVCILEARDRIGGRIHTINAEGFDQPIEAGAEFVHGQLPETLGLLHAFSIEAIPFEEEGATKTEDGFEEEEDNEEGLIAQLRRLKKDIPVSSFLKTVNEEEADYLRSYVEGYFAADPDRASSLALLEDMESPEEIQYRVGRGYGQLMEAMFKDALAHQLAYFDNTVVTHIDWQQSLLHITTSRGIVKAGKVIITVPLGVLQSGCIEFTPSLPEKDTAIKSLGFGGVIKFSFQFNEAFWEDSGRETRIPGGPVFFFSEEKVPTWWTQKPSPSLLLTGWLAGHAADEYRQFGDEALRDMAFQSLSAIFNEDENRLRQICRSSLVHNWCADPLSRGGYAYETVGAAEARAALSAPVDNRIYFAGEALCGGKIIGTVEAALRSGKEVAERILSA